MMAADYSAGAASLYVDGCVGRGARAQAPGFADFGASTSRPFLPRSQLRLAAAGMRSRSRGASLRPSSRGRAPARSSGLSGPERRGRELGPSARRGRRSAWAEGGTMSDSSAEAQAPPWPERPPEGVMRTHAPQLASAASRPPWPERPPEGVIGPPWPERLPEGVVRTHAQRLASAASRPPWPERLPEGVVRTHAQRLASAASRSPWPERPPEGATAQPRPAPTSMVTVSMMTASEGPPPASAGSATWSERICSNTSSPEIVRPKRT